MAEGILQDLHNDHQEVSTMIETIMKTEDSKERTSLFKEMMTMLLAHSHAEQNVLYKKMEKSEDEEGRKFAFEGTNEHQIVEQQLQLLAKAGRVRSEADPEETAGQPQQLWNCPHCGGPMVLIQRLTAIELRLRSPPVPTSQQP